MELTNNLTSVRTLTQLCNPFYLGVVMSRVNEIVNHMTLSPLKRKTLRRTYDNINFKNSSFTWVDEGETSDEVRMSDAFQVRMMLSEEFNIGTTDTKIQNFKNHYQTLITLKII
tara:strand:+ start:353 stop:694 length:342 start_codon:yes stop_codon:yes gene_type:complete